MPQRKRFRGLSFVATFLCALSLATAPLPAAENASPTEDRSWDESIAAFAADDLKQSPSPGGVVFVGSSSIRLWRDLEKQWDAARVVNRGFGGARLSDCTRYVDRLVLPHAPRLIVVYAGDNDLAEGRQPKEVFNEFVRFVGAVRNALPNTRIAYISIKPSPLRARLIPQVREANQLIEKFTSLGENLEFVDVFTPMLDAAGQPRAELFQSDALHLNGTGYQLWASIIGPRLR